MRSGKRRFQSYDEEDNTQQPPAAKASNASTTATIAQKLQAASAKVPGFGEFAESERQQTALQESLEEVSNLKKIFLTWKTELDQLGLIEWKTEFQPAIKKAMILAKTTFDKGIDTLKEQMHITRIMESQEDAEKEKTNMAVLLRQAGNTLQAATEDKQIHHVLSALIELTTRIQAMMDLVSKSGPVAMKVLLDSKSLISRLKENAEEQLSKAMQQKNVKPSATATQHRV